MKLIKTTPRFAILARVSTREQISGHSLEVQQDLCEKYVRKAGGKAVHVYSGQESATTEDRTVLPRLLADAGKVYSDLVFEELTRLSRNPATMFTAVNHLTSHGVRIHTVNGPLDTSSPEGEFQVMINSVIGRFTARQGVKKSINARLHVLRNGGIAAGRPPWGRRWTRQEKKFDVIPERQALMREVYDLIVNRKRSLLEAAKRVGMAPSSLRKAVNQAAWSKVEQTLQGETFEFKCPSLLNVFEQRRLVRRIEENRIVRPTVSGKYLLQGLVKCAKCGAHMTGMTSIKGNYRYAVYRHAPARYKDGCTWQVPQALLDDDILTACAETVKSGTALRDAIRAELSQRNGGEEPKLRERRKVIKQAIRKWEDEIDRLMDALAALGKNAPEQAKKRTLKRLTELEGKLVADKAAIEKIDGEISDMEMPDVDADALAAKLRSLYWASGAGPQVALTFEQRKTFIRTIIGVAPELGIYVTMHRRSSSKKDVFWKYEIKGLIGSASNYLDVDAEKADYPEVSLVNVPRSGVKQLAHLADRTPGIRYVPMHRQSSSGASHRCG